MRWKRAVGYGLALAKLTIAEKHIGLPLILEQDECAPAPACPPRLMSTEQSLQNLIPINTDRLDPYSLDAQAIPRRVLCPRQICLHPWGAP